MRLIFSSQKVKKHLTIIGALYGISSPLAFRVVSLGVVGLASENKKHLKIDLLFTKFYKNRLEWFEAG